MTKFAEFETTAQRLCMLRFLNESKGKFLNESMLHRTVRTMHHISRETIREHIKWLEAAELVDTDETRGILGAVLTKKGIDVANGDASVDGVLPATKSL